MNDIYKILSKLRETNSRNDKESILRENIDNELFKKVLYYALNPRKQFYIKKLPAVKTHVDEKQLEDCFEILDMLSSREISGNYARDSVCKLKMSLSEEVSHILDLIISKDLKCGVNVATVNKIFQKLIPEIPYQRCRLLKDMKKDSIDWSVGLYSQEKLDGMFANIIVKNDTDDSSVLSRAGSPFALEPFKNIINDLKTIGAPYVFMGELLVYYGDELLERQVGNGILNSLLQTDEFDSKKYTIKFIVWDVIPEADFEAGKCNTNYADRFDMLSPISSQVVSICPTEVVYSFEQAKQHYKRLALEGKEGTILKVKDSIWKDGTSNQMWKFKVEAEVDLRAVGYNEGNGKNAGLIGSIICVSEDELLEVSVSGITDDLRKQISENREKYMNIIVSVLFNSIMRPEGKKVSLFLPRFAEFRYDKQTANTLQEIEDIFESVINE